MPEIPLAIYDPSSPKNGDYWQFVSPGLSSQLADLDKAWFNGFPEPRIGEHPTSPVFTWSLGAIHDGASLWLYRKYWAGREREARPGRHFYILLRLDSPKQATDIAVERFLKAFEGDQTIPLATRPSLLTQDCLRLEGQGHHPALTTFAEHFLGNLNKQHVGAEFDANGKQLNQFSKELQDVRKQSMLAQPRSQSCHTKSHSHSSNPSGTSHHYLPKFNISFLIGISIGLAVGCIWHTIVFKKYDAERKKLIEENNGLKSELKDSTGAASTSSKRNSEGE